MKVNFTVADSFNAPPDQVYKAWLNTEEHTAMTGAEALISSVIGETFMAWDGYISGENIALESNKRILQHWRTSEFEDTDEDSVLEILFERSKEGTLITINHSNLPEHGMQYKQGWIDAYFTPMKAYF